MKARNPLMDIGLWVFMAAMSLRVGYLKVMLWVLTFVDGPQKVPLREGQYFQLWDGR